ncbi:hypothetical protein GGI04_000838 [Coemansia thaxteri]|uniref:Trafficking protein particle complex subunit 12 n=1 Tax=Coemansia thaxteri TaxID=2663907 RepID=A0A9W8BJA6_9FUNG|nr:hypothetical protein H4R26_002165 [Coemansia thaxteri]KAJ2008965.1 hypothetical protein GGI04_000838 [Coemansia thaxteri]KAJ2473594.1 hypothetical protein GGI02_000744 [Coemansia sp. RSA 2322]KAJ2485881.1 hypothetical protein EV174_001455 [Coemansia sp. RSA 2320]
MSRNRGLGHWVGDPGVWHTHFRTHTYNNDKDATAQSPAAGLATSTWRTFNDPRLFEPTPLQDSLDETLSTYVSGDMRPRREAPSPDDFVRRVHGYEILNQYVVGGQWRALALAAEASIVETAAHEERTLLKYWVYRTMALIQLNVCELASRELSRLEQASQYATTARRAVRRGKSPTIAWPFELRVLRAQAPGLAHGSWGVSIDRLSALLRGCRRAAATKVAEDEQDDELVYKQRGFHITLLIIGCIVKMHDSALATQVLDRLVSESPPDPLLLSAAARLYLQLGGISSAERLFVQVEGLATKDDKVTLMNRALYAVAAGKWDSAREMFAKIHADHPERVAAANNMALCDLYLGNPQAMLNGLKQLMAAAPTAAGTSELLVFNYCTGLDLHYDGPRLRDAKVKKMVEVATWAGDGFDTDSFKL